MPDPDQNPPAEEDQQEQGSGDPGRPPRRRPSARDRSLRLAFPLLPSAIRDASRDLAPRLLADELAFRSDLMATVEYTLGAVLGEMEGALKESTMASLAKVALDAVALQEKLLDSVRKSAGRESADQVAGLLDRRALLVRFLEQRGVYRDGQLVRQAAQAGGQAEGYQDRAGTSGTQPELDPEGPPAPLRPDLGPAHPLVLLGSSDGSLRAVAPAEAEFEDCPIPAPEVPEFRTRNGGQRPGFTGPPASRAKGMRGGVMSGGPGDGSPVPRETKEEDHGGEELNERDFGAQPRPGGQLDRGADRDDRS